MTDTLYELLDKRNKSWEHVFTNKDTGKPYTDIRKSFGSVLKKAGIEGLRFHNLRRTVGMWLKDEGVDIRTIQVLLAHSNISTTERYLAYTREQNIKAVNIPDNIAK